MTKTEAADIIATDVVVWARQHDRVIDKDLVELRMSELGGYAYRGTWKGLAVKVGPSRRTVLRLATKMVVA